MNGTATGIEEVLSFDDAFFSEYAARVPRLLNVAKLSSCPHTFHALFGLQSSVNTIKLGIYDLAEKTETHLYNLNILFRVQIEHFVKFQYLFARLHLEGSDAVGLEYKKYSAISETIDYVNALAASAKMAGMNSDDEVLRKIKKDHPEFDISATKLKEIVGRWKHKSIIRYIKSASDRKNLETPPLFFSFIPLYASLSSFIHGGRFAEEYYMEMLASETLSEKACLIVRRAAFICACAQSQIFILIASIDKSFTEDVNVLLKLLDEFTDRHEAF